jgi:hypothetical protein
MLTKPIADLKVADVQALLGVAESRYLDFKSAPVGAADRDRREFLADVSAFANASGGDILFGVDEQDGAASAVSGISLPDADKEKLRLGDLIRSGLEPRLTHFEITWLPMARDVGVLVVRVPRSWTAPHRVTLQGHDKFYIRNSAGKHPMNVDELRRAFTLGEEVADRIRRFRAERVGLLLSDNGPFPVSGGPKLIQHIVPLGAVVDPADLKLSPESATDLRPLGVSGYSWRYSLDGLALYNEGANKVTYTLAFRNGIVELVSWLPTDERKLINLSRMERYAAEAWEHYRRFSAKQGIEPPLYHFLSLASVKGLGVHLPAMHAYDNSIPSRQDLLLLPEVVTSTELETLVPQKVLRPAFDLLANAFGLSRSFNFRADGQYEPVPF